MKTLFPVWLLTVTLAGPILAAPPSERSPPAKNGTVAFLAGAALHLAQNARALQSASTKKREKEYGPSDPQVKAGHRNLRVIRRKQHYFRHVKRRSEGRKPIPSERHRPH